MPDGAEGNGPATEQATTVATQDWNPGFAKDENSSNRDLSAPVDWDKESKEGFSLDNFKDSGRKVTADPKNEEAVKLLKDNEQQDNQTGKEGTETVETEVQEGKEVQTDDTPEGRRTAAEQNDATKTGTETQQVAEEDPILKAFPAAKTFLKKMSKESAEFVKARLSDAIAQKKELEEVKLNLATAQEGRSIIPKSLYENPNAYLLLPEFHRSSFAVDSYTKIYNYWREQRRNILNGKEWQDSKDITDDKGNFLRVEGDGKLLSASGDAQDRVEEELKHAFNQLQQAQQNQQYIVNNFQGRVRETLTIARNVEKDLFPPDKWDNKETPEYKVVETARGRMREMGFTETNPLFNITAKLGAQVLLLRDYIQANIKKTNTVKSIIDSTRRAGPTGNVTASAGGAQTSASGDDVVNAFKKMQTQSRV